MDNSLKIKRDKFLNEKTPKLESVRLIQQSRELTLRKAKIDEKFRKYREWQTESLYEYMEENIMAIYINNEKFAFIFNYNKEKQDFQEEFSKCLNIFSMNESEDEILLCLIFIRKIFLSKKLTNVCGIEEFITFLINYLQTTDNCLILIELIWILSIFVSINYEVSKIFIEKKCIQIIHSLLSKGNLSSMVFEQICILIGNLSKEKRILAEYDFFSLIFKTYLSLRSEKLEKSILPTLYGICHSKLYVIEGRMERKFIKHLSKIYIRHLKNEKILILATISQISNFSITPVPYIVEYFTEILAINFNKMCFEIEPNISQLSLTIIGNITTADNLYIDKFLNKTDLFLHKIKHLIKCDIEENLLKEIFFIISNLAAGHDKYVEMIFDAQLEEELFGKTYCPRIEEDTVWVIANLTNSNKEENLIKLLNAGFLKKIEYFLDIKFNFKINCLCLEALENLLYKTKNCDIKIVTNFYQVLVNYIKNETEIVSKIELITNKDIGTGVASKIFDHFSENLKL